MTAATLRSLYGRATRAFLRRDTALTHSLLQSAFDVLHPPPSYPDPLAEFRRKWDILRITLETMVYISPPAPQSELSDELKQMLLQSPQTLLKSMYVRSLALFTPSESAGAPSPTYLPGQVLLTLVYSSIKMNCHDSGRYMIEEWLARGDLLTVPDSGVNEGDSYEKVLESYCLHILPNLEQWDYACEFLQHETELPDNARQKLKATFDLLYTQALAARKTPQPKPRQFMDFSPSTAGSTRPASPTPSTSSSSSLSTTSTHTIKPSNARGRRELNGLSSISALPSASASTTSLDSDTAATIRGHPLSRNPQHTNGHAPHHPQPNDPHHPTNPSSGTKRSSSSSSRPSSSSSSPWLPFASHTQTTAFDSSNPSLYALIKTTITSYFTLPKLSTFLIIFVLFPVISFLLRYRHKRRKLIAASGGANVTPAHGGVTPLRNPHAGNASSNADLVRKRLQQFGAGGDGSVFQRLWTEVVRMLVDTVKMAGSGLV